MPKNANKYIKTDPWLIIEDKFDPEKGRISESIFSLSNEYMGIRGYFDEGYSGDKLVGSYLNGIFEEKILEKQEYKGISNRICFMVNTMDWLYTRIKLDQEILDLAKSNISSFKRILDMRTGILSREFIWHLNSGKNVKVVFKRLLGMNNIKVGGQRIIFKPLNFSGEIEVCSGIDFSVIHESMEKNFWNITGKFYDDDLTGIAGITINSLHRIFCSFKIACAIQPQLKRKESEKFTGVEFKLKLSKDKVASFDKIVLIHNDKNLTGNDQKFISEGLLVAKKYSTISFNELLNENTLYWKKIWESFDVEIHDDVENQQGIRYCIFQLNQTYHGEDPELNIGAKGLTGEIYNGHTFWDTETYCLPFYLFNNPKAAKNLLEFRYNTLPQAIERAALLDCEGACYPVATLDGTESCTLWQHASLQLQASTGVAYGIWHYLKITDDIDFLHNKGIVLLLHICRFLASRGQWSGKTGEFGFFCVMGPDEFQMMVNNNCYTNFMAKKTFEYTLDVMNDIKKNKKQIYNKIINNLALKDSEIEYWGKIISKMKIPRDIKTGIYEEHDGFFDLPHIDIKSIPENDFPLYHSWSYDRIFRNDMIKQPDVLMLMFLYNQDFTPDLKKANYEYYEPRCIHESSLSPSIHSILASELGRKDEAFNFFRFATRMDLDNYNNNTNEGLHITSIAAAWINIVYGFGGLRSDGDILSLNPSIPGKWKSYSFKILYRGSLLSIKVEKTKVILKILSGNNISLKIYDMEYSIGKENIKVQLE